MTTRDQEIIDFYKTKYPYLVSCDNLYGTVNLERACVWCATYADGKMAWCALSQNVYFFFEDSRLATEFALRWV